MAEAAEARDGANATLVPDGDGEVLHFLARTLQAHIIDAEPRSVLAKLRNLRAALEQQEATLSQWPESASKARMCAALAKARSAVAQIVDDLTAKPAADAVQPAAQAG